MKENHGMGWKDGGWVGCGRSIKSRFHFVQFRRRRQDSNDVCTNLSLSTLFPLCLQHGAKNFLLNFVSKVPPWLMGCASAALG